MSRLNRATAMATRRPLASSSPSNAAYSPKFVVLDVVDVQEMAELLLLRAKVRDVLHVRLGQERHALGDLESVTLEAAVLAHVVRHQPHRGDTEVDENLRADAVLTRV